MADDTELYARGQRYLDRTDHHAERASMDENCDVGDHGSNGDIAEGIEGSSHYDDHRMIYMR